MIKLIPRGKDFPEVRNKAEIRINKKKDIKKDCSDVINAVLDKYPEGYDYWHVISELFYIKQVGTQVIDALNKIITNGKNKYVLFQIDVDKFKLFKIKYHLGLNRNKVLPNRASDEIYSKQDFLPDKLKVTEENYDDYFFND